jgi:hypothetical protein
MARAHNGKYVEVVQLHSVYDFKAYLDATELKGHGSARHDQCSVMLDVFAKSTDVHSCEITIMEPTNPDYDRDRPRKAVARFRSRNYGDAECVGPPACT